MLWNMVDAREKTDLYEKAGRVMDGTVTTEDDVLAYSPVQE